MKTVAALAIALAAVPALAAAPTPFEAADLYRLSMVTDPKVAPDGRHILFTRASFDIQSDTRQGEIWLATLDGTRLERHLLLGAGVKASHVEWSPDGTRIAYVAPYLGKPQLWTMVLADGVGRVVTSGKTGPGGFAWSPRRRQHRLHRPGRGDAAQDRADARQAGGRDLGARAQADQRLFLPRRRRRLCDRRGRPAVRRRRRRQQSEAVDQGRFRPGRGRRGIVVAGRPDHPVLSDVRCRPRPAGARERPVQRARGGRTGDADHQDQGQRAESQGLAGRTNAGLRRRARGADILCPVRPLGDAGRRG